MEVSSYPGYKRGHVYRFPLAWQVISEFSWPEFIVIHPLRKQLINDPNQPGQPATLVEVFTVLLSECEQFVEPFQAWELN